VRVLYFDCFSGISGDMTLAALLDLGADFDRVRQAVQAMGLRAELSLAETKKKGIRAKQLQVLAEEGQPKRHFADIKQLIESADVLNDKQRELACSIFHRLAEAEAAVHGTTPDQVHFHEVGAVDSIVDIVGAVVALDSLCVDQVFSSWIPVGSGSVSSEHGRLPVPAPATAELLKGVPLSRSTVPVELTTPTGAALITTVASEFGPIPHQMQIERIGYGAGQRDLPEQPNVLRVFLGTVPGEASVDHVWVLETELDDVAGELVGYCVERLLQMGALDVYTTAVGMKKNRPGVLITVLAPAEKYEELELELMRQTGTFGVRRYLATRAKLRRKRYSVTTPFGQVEGKLGWTASVKPIFSPEYESCRQVAESAGVPLREVYAAAIRAYDPDAAQRL